MPEPNDAQVTNAGADNTGAANSPEVIAKVKLADSMIEKLKDVGFGTDEEDLEQLFEFANEGAKAMRTVKPEPVKEPVKVEVKGDTSTPVVAELTNRVNQTWWENKFTNDRIGYMLEQRDIEVDKRDGLDVNELDSLVRSPNTGPAIFALAQDKSFGKNLYKAAAQFVKVQKGAAIGKEQGIKMAQDLEKSKQALAGENGQKPPEKKAEDQSKRAADVIAPDTKYIP